jgi:hypothetical protein
LTHDHLIKFFIFLKKLKNIFFFQKKKEKKKPLGTKRWLGVVSTTIRGGFGHPLGSMGVAEPPLGAQGGGRSHPRFFFFLKKYIFKKKGIYIR